MISVLAIGVGLAACKAKTHSPKESPDSTGSMESEKISYYTCPMHPQIHRDEPGNCPICGMTLVPVMEGGQGKMPTQPGSFHLSPEKQQLIGVRFATAEMKDSSREIRALGRVAFDPELAIAQREYLEISKTVPSLREASASRLKLLGMSSDEIRGMEKRGRSDTSLYLPTAKDPLWIYATLYAGDMDLVKPGQSAIIRDATHPDKPVTGLVRAVDPVINPSSRSVRARIEVPLAGEMFRPETVVDVGFSVDLGKKLTVPKSAILDTGIRKIAFVVHEDSHFQPQEVTTGPEVGENQVILEGLNEGDRVVASATFLIDSESQLKGALANTGGHQH